LPLCAVKVDQGRATSILWQKNVRDAVLKVLGVRAMCGCMELITIPVDTDGVDDMFYDSLDTCTLYYRGWP